MASFVRRAPPRPAWTLEERALFAARKEFELLRLLSTDKKAFATARRLGVFSYSHSQPQASNVAMDAAAAPSCSTAAAGAPPTAADPSRARRSAARRAQPAPQAGPQPQPHPPTPAVAVDAGRDAGVAARALPPAVVAMAAPNARERRSAVRSGRRHAARRQRLVRCQVWALVFLLKLRRRARLRRDLTDLEELSAAPADDASASKRVRSDSPPTSESSGDPLDYEHHHVLGVARTTTRAPAMQRARRDWWQELMPK